MQIELKTLSPLLSASGESSAYLDADVKYDKFGLPYLPGKTFKGLLRESAVEVCEIRGETETETEKVINTLFGKVGDSKSGSLQFNNLRLTDYNTIKGDLVQLPKLTSKIVQSYFTVIRKQTTIDENDVAADKSLRTYRLIRKDQEFAGEIGNTENIDDAYNKILEQALVNIRYIGTRRNRGFGKVRIRETETQAVPNKEHQVAAPNVGCCKLTYLVTTKSPLQISKQVGDQNTVSTEDFIPAQNIRGLIAELIIKDRNCSQKAHDDARFKTIILSGEVKYESAFPCIKGTKFEPIPLALGIIKTEKKENRKLDNIFMSKNAKPVKGWCSISEEEIYKSEVSISSNFHSTRKDDRTAGRSTKKDGAIFYYESIDEEQSFKGEIIGDFEDLNYIKNLLESNNAVHRTGRSKTAQYSVIELSDITIESFKPKDIEHKGNEFYIVFQSPVIVYNEFGTAIPDEKYLQIALDRFNIKIKKIASRNTLVENYMGVWNSKTNRENGYAIGTTVLATVNGEVDWKKMQTNGIGERTNEGYGRVKVIMLGDQYQPRKLVDEPLVPSAIKSLTVSNILDFYNKQQTDNGIKTKAIQDSISYKLNNHLVYRLKEQLNNSSSITEWQTFLDSLKGKKADTALNSEHLREKLYQLESDGNDNITEGAKLYWNTFFNTLRVKSKREK